MGCIIKKKKKANEIVKKQKVIHAPLKTLIKYAEGALKRVKFSNANKAIKIALKLKTKLMKKRIIPSRVIPIPKTGGMLPLIPIFAGLSALGALSGCVTGINKAVNDAKAEMRNLMKVNDTIK